MAGGASSAASADDPEIPPPISQLVEVAAQAMAEANAKVQSVVLRAKLAAATGGEFDTVGSLRYIAKVAAVAQGELAERVGEIAKGVESGALSAAEAEAAIARLGADFTGDALDARVGAAPVASEDAMRRELADMGRSIEEPGSGGRVGYSTVAVVVGVAVGAGVLLGAGVAAAVVVARKQQRKRRAAAASASAAAAVSTYAPPSAAATVTSTGGPARYASKMGNPTKAAPSPAELN